MSRSGRPGGEGGGEVPRAPSAAGELEPAHLASASLDELPQYVSVVIPAAGEEAHIGALLARVDEILATRVRKHELIVVVPHPEDPTGGVAREAGARVLVQKRPGYGGALKEGIQAARGDHVVTMDADFTHPPEALATLLAHYDAAEVVICSRYVEGGSARMSLTRNLLSRVLNAVYSRVLAVPVRDMSSGFRIYPRHVFDELEITAENYDVLQEILVKIYCLGWRVVEIPFAYMPRVGGESHARPFGFAPHFLRTLGVLFSLRNDFRSADYDSRAHDSLVLPQRYWQRRRFEIVTRMMGDASPRADVGCGSSRIIQSRPDSVGLDISQPKLRFLRRTNPKRVRGTTFALPFRTGSLGGVVHSQVIEHVPFDRRIFRELNRVLRPGGVLVIGTPDYGRVQWRVIEWLYKLLMPNSYGDDHITHYTRRGLTEELAEAGFGITGYEYILGGELVIRCVKREELPSGSDAR